MAKSNKGGISNQVKGAVAGCAVMVGNVVVGGFVVLIGLGFLVKDTVANYAPSLFTNNGLGFLAAPSQAVAPIKTTDTYGCELSWSRDITLKMINYTISCAGKTNIEFENVKVTVISPSEQAIGDIFETQTSVDEVVFRGTDKCKREDADHNDIEVACYKLEDQERFEESGTLRADPIGRPTQDTYRKVLFTADIRYTDEPLSTKIEKGDKYQLRIASTEGDW